MDLTRFQNALNQQQFAAATAPDGPVLILAGAGTGKTRTLVYRVAYLVEKGIDPARILLLTFTNRAAHEMLDRARNLVRHDVGGLWGGTFHHMANRILRRHAKALGYPNAYTILDRDDTLSLVRRCLDERKVATEGFPKPQVLLSLYGSSANTETTVPEALNKRFPWLDPFAGDIVAVHDDFQKRKRELGAMDFDDLLVNGLKLFRENPAILQEYRERFLYVLVDEYQDTNSIQADWIDLIAGLHRNLTVVGDDFQSIYGWRGADCGNILSFPQRYADSRTFMLEINYRNVPEILSVANACIAGNPEQFQKTLRSTRAEHHRPVLARPRDGDSQAQFVVQEIRRLLRRYPANEIAVLYRAHHHAMELQMCLQQSQVRFVVTSGMRFFEQAHVKDVCSFLRILQNPGDELAFQRLVGMFPKVGEKTAAKLWTRLNRRFAGTPAEVDLVRDLLPAAARPSWQALTPLVVAWADEHLEAQPGEVAKRFVKAFYDRYARESFENYSHRMEELQALLDFMARFDTVQAFLSDVALLSNLDAEMEGPDEAAKPAVRLSTVHQAKGLEWDVVFVIGMTEGQFPSGRALAESPAAEAEERRLFYVAVTRARNELVFCAPEIRRGPDGRPTYAAPSRFLREIPQELLGKSSALY